MQHLQVEEKKNSVVFTKTFHFIISRTLLNIYQLQLFQNLGLQNLKCS